MTIWFTSDHHFHHRNIIKLCNRPYDTVESMNDALIAKWNMVVAPKDEVWYLGDFGFFNSLGGIDEAKLIFEMLHGQKHLIVGNHDHKRVRALDWKSVQKYHRLKVNGVYIILCHYPIENWELRREENSIHLHGHSHGRSAKIPYKIDVGVDANHFIPLSLKAILCQFDM
mgnify:CR=1 FL=1